MAPGRSHWRDAPDRALYPFGSGMGYTRFALSDLSVPAVVQMGADVPVSAMVRNVGKRAGTTLVRIDLHDRVASRTRPVRQMKAFARVTLAAGEARRVELRIAARELALVASDGRWRVEPGAFDLWVVAGDGVEVKGEFVVR